MDYFKTEKLNDHTYRICDITGVQMYLVIGKDTAALIDTGCGVGDLAGLVRTLTDKPVIVLLTHGHVDHAMGAADFNVVYMNRLDIPVFIDHSRTEMRVEYISMNCDFDEECLLAMRTPAATDHFLPVGDGDKFDLGGIHIKMFSCPGHTPGSMVPLIVEDRVLIPGDACNWLTFMYMPEAASVEKYRESLVKLRKRTEGAFDTVWFSHGDVDGQCSILTDGIDLCDRIIDGTATGNMEFSFMEWKGLVAEPVNEELFRPDGVLMNIVYDRQRINSDAAQ